MLDNINYYELLGIPKSATNSDIKTSFRKLVKEVHPDINKGVPFILRKIKDKQIKIVFSADSGKDSIEVSEYIAKLKLAHDILINEEDRKNYDNRIILSSEKVKTKKVYYTERDIYSSISLDNIYSNDFLIVDLEPRVGSNIYYSVRSNSLFNAKKIKYKKVADCNECNGLGVVNKGSTFTCPACKGTGRIKHKTCLLCYGLGYCGFLVCRSCKGKGRKSVITEIKLNDYFIEKSNKKLIIKGAGNKGHLCDKDGDLIIILE